MNTAVKADGRYSTSNLHQRLRCCLRQRRQLARQVNSQFYERTALSKDKAAMLTKGQAPKPGDAVTVEECGGPGRGPGVNDAAHFVAASRIMVCSISSQMAWAAVR